MIATDFEVQWPDLWLISNFFQTTQAQKENLLYRNLVGGVTYIQMSIF